MDSLVVFIIIVAVNIIAKSAQEKKKIEKAKTERARQLRNNPIPNMPSQAQRTQPTREKRSKNRDVKEVFKEKREKDYYDRRQEYIDTKKGIQENYNTESYNYTIKENERKTTISRESYLEGIKRDSLENLEVEGQELSKEIGRAHV